MYTSGQCQVQQHNINDGRRMRKLPVLKLTKRPIGVSPLLLLVATTNLLLRAKWCNALLCIRQNHCKHHRCRPLRPPLIGTTTPAGWKDPTKTHQAAFGCRLLLGAHLHDNRNENNDHFAPGETNDLKTEYEVLQSQQTSPVTPISRIFQSTEASARVIKIGSTVGVTVLLLAFLNTGFRRYFIPSGCANFLPGTSFNLLRGGSSASDVVASVSSSSNSHPALRLGEQAFGLDGKYDIGRIRMRLEGLQSYSTISALLMNASLRLFSATKQPADPSSENSKAHLHYMYNVFLAADILSVLLGAYTTIVFTMVSLYSKQALGRALDIEFLNFYTATQKLREFGFSAFVGSLVSFQVAFIGTLYCNLRGRKRQVFVTLATAIATFTVTMLRQVMSSATKFIFT